VEAALVESLSLADREELDPVRVVRDEHDARVESLVVECELERMPVLHNERVGACAREQLAAAPVMLAAVDESRVEAERDVVEERAPVHSAEVDSTFLACEPGKRPDGVVAVEAEVAREMVARAVGDADERELALDRDARDGGERPVAARHPQSVGIRFAGKLLEVVVLAEDVHGDTEGARLGLELLRRRAAVAGAWIHDQKAGQGGEA